MKHPLLAGLAASGWRTGTLLLAVTAAAAMAFGSPAALKSALSGSGAYTAAADRLATRASDAVNAETGQATDNKAVEAAAKASITPESLQKSAEQNIDSVYTWLEGETEKPDIKLDLSPYVNNFKQQVGDEALKRAQSLPVCTPEQLRLIDPSKIDVLNLPCQPPGINLSSAKDQAIAGATQSNEFLSNPVITTDSLPKDAEGKTAVDRAAKVPDMYAWAMRAPWIFVGLALVSAVAFVLLVRPDWRLAAHRLGRSLFFIGVVLIILTFAGKYLFANFTKSDSVTGKLSGDEFGDIALSFVTSIANVYSNRLLWFAFAYAGIGAVVWLAVRYIKPPAAIAVTSGPDSTIDSNDPNGHVV